MKLADHAADLVTFYTTLTDGGVDAEVAGVCTIDANKAILSGQINLESAAPTKTEQLAEVAQAAEEKRERRQAQLDAQASS